MTYDTCNEVKKLNISLTIQRESHNICYLHIAETFFNVSEMSGILFLFDCMGKIIVCVEGGGCLRKLSHDVSRVLLDLSHFAGESSKLNKRSYRTVLSQNTVGDKPILFVLKRKYIISTSCTLLVSRSAFLYSQYPVSAIGKK